MPSNYLNILIRDFLNVSRTRNTFWKIINMYSCYLQFEQLVLFFHIVTRREFEVCHLTQTKHVAWEPLLEALVEAAIAGVGITDTLRGGNRPCPVPAELHIK